MKTRTSLSLASLLSATAALVLSAAPLWAQFPTPTYGWNLGNTLEPPSGEGSWAPAATQQMINAVADAGFNTIRLPVAWDSHANQQTHQINAGWMSRVKEVVDWCLDAELTVVLNTHWDGGWLENNIGAAVDPTIDAKMASYWTQIADTFADYDDRLLFAAANEPNVDNAAQMSTLTHYYQTFVDAVRGRGGANAERWLVVQGPRTDISKTDQLMNALPTDPTQDRLAVEVHYYDPWQFAGLERDESWGDMFYFWGEEHRSTAQPGRNATHSQEAHLAAQLQKMHDKFVSQGVPVILGEFSALNRTGNPDLVGAELELHLAAREAYHTQIVDTANSLGIAPFYWDNGHTGANGSGIFNRLTAAVADQRTVAAVTGGSGLAGDFNADGLVDAADYTVWRDTGGGADNYFAWWGNYGAAAPAPGEATVVPEPHSQAVLAVLAGAGSLWRMLTTRPAKR